MATITISEQQYQTLLQRATRLNTSPETLLDHLLERFLGHALIPIKGSDSLEATPIIRTLGEVLKYGYGFWADRDDIEDPLNPEVTPDPENDKQLRAVIAAGTGLMPLS